MNTLGIDCHVVLNGQKTNGLHEITSKTCKYIKNMKVTKKELVEYILWCKHW